MEKSTNKIGSPVLYAHELPNVEPLAIVETHADENDQLHFSAYLALRNAWPHRPMAASQAASFSGLQPIE